MHIRTYPYARWSGSCLLLHCTACTFGAAPSRCAGFASRPCFPLKEIPPRWVGEVGISCTWGVAGGLGGFPTRWDGRDRGPNGFFLVRWPRFQQRLQGSLLARSNYHPRFAQNVPTANHGLLTTTRHHHHTRHAFNVPRSKHMYACCAPSPLSSCGAATFPPHRTSLVRREAGSGKRRGRQQNKNEWVKGSKGGMINESTPRDNACRPCRAETTIDVGRRIAAKLKAKSAAPDWAGWLLLTRGSEQQRQRIQ